MPLFGRATHVRLVRRIAALDVESQRLQLRDDAAEAARERTREPYRSVVGVQRVIGNRVDRLRVVLLAIVPNDVVAGPLETMSLQELVAAKSVALLHCVQHGLPRDVP